MKDNCAYILKLTFQLLKSDDGYTRTDHLFSKYLLGEPTTCLALLDLRGIPEIESVILLKRKVILR